MDANRIIQTVNEVTLPSTSHAHRRSDTRCNGSNINFKAGCNGGSNTTYDATTTTVTARFLTREMLRIHDEENDDGRSPTSVQIPPTTGIVVNRGEASTIITTTRHLRDGAAIDGSGGAMARRGRRRRWRIPSPPSTWSNRGTFPPSSSSTSNATSVGAAIPSVSRSAPSTASAPSVPPLLSRPQEGRPRLVRSTGNRGLVSMGRQPPFSDMHDVIARLNHSSIGQNSHSSNANAYNSNVYSIDPSLFGNGSNNRGTNAAKIRSLPYFTIADVEKELPPDTAIVRSVYRISA